MTPLLRAPWSSAPSGSSSASRASTSSLSSSSRTESPSGPVTVQRISGPMPKRPAFVEAPVERPQSQTASLLFGNGVGGGGGSKRVSQGSRWSVGSSRRTSEGQRQARVDEEDEDRPPLQPIVEGVPVFVTTPAEGDDGRSVSPSTPQKASTREKRASGTSGQERFSVFTMDNVRDLEQAEEGAVLLWMNQLAVTPHPSQNDLTSRSAPEETPPLSPSSTATSSPASHRGNLAATPPPRFRNSVTPPTSTESHATPEKSRARLSFSPPSLKSGRTAQDPPLASTSPLSKRLFHPSRWGKQAPSSPALPASRAETEGDVFSSSPHPGASGPGPPPSLGRSLAYPTGLGMSISDPSLALPPTSTSSASPRASASAVRFASSSHPTPEHGRSTSEVDRLEWEFVPRTTPSYELGQRYAPPVEPKGAVRRVLQPHPKVRGRKSWRAFRDPPAPTPKNGSMSASRTNSAGSRTPVSTRTPERASGSGSQPAAVRSPAPSVETEDVSLSCGTSKGKGKEVVA